MTTRPRATKASAPAKKATATTPAPESPVVAEGLLAFWSYVHDDDTLDQGRVTQLAHDIVGHYEAMSTENLRLFLDKDNLRWGDQWRDDIDEALSNVAFFIPVLTPRFFTRPECIRELKFFLDRTKSLGLSELVLPIHYIDVPELTSDDEPDDELLLRMRDTQWEDWRDLRFADRSSRDYRRAVDNLAKDLVRRVKSVERLDIVKAAERAESEALPDGDELGLIDRLAALEEAMPRWNKTLTDLSREVDVIGSLMVEGTADMEKSNSQGKGFAARLSVARRVAEALDEPVTKIERLSKDFIADLDEVDAGYRALIRHAAEEVRDDPSLLPEVCEFLATLRSLAESSEQGLGSIAGMIEASEGIEGMSKDMRPVVRRLRASLTTVYEARAVTSDWIVLIETSGINCAGIN